MEATVRVGGAMEAAEMVGLWRCGAIAKHHTAATARLEDLVSLDTSTYRLLQDDHNKLLRSMQNRNSLPP